MAAPRHGIGTEVTILKHGGIKESNAANHEAWSITYSSDENHATGGLVEYLVVQEQVLIQSASLTWRTYGRTSSTSC
ncbi:hypothetical protein QJS10_CPB11g01716 [Acorus calamus]|uniref:Uncharacterized protein n=1 Tax=Acorus calamus TaxID=4465 RepID=A0AAV9DWD4_ACOCL|nr:hypothetical protein QJS10_CPB11g01716 [Acorus calamus]